MNGMCTLCGVQNLSPLSMFVLGVIQGRSATLNEAQIAEVMMTSAERMKNMFGDEHRKVFETAEAEARAYLIQSMPPGLRATFEHALRAGPTPTMTDRLSIGLDLCDAHQKEFAESAEYLMGLIAETVNTQ